MIILHNSSYIKSRKSSQGDREVDVHPLYPFLISAPDYTPFAAAQSYKSLHTQLYKMKVKWKKYPRSVLKYV